MYYFSWGGKREDLGVYAQQWLPYGVKYIGGCCRTNVDDIVAIKQAVHSYSSSAAL